MGSERKLYLGPYFEVRSPKNTATFDHCKNKDSCPDPQNLRKNHTSFCDRCGIRLRDRIHAHQYRPDFIEILASQALMSCVDYYGMGALEDEESHFISCLVPNFSHGLGPSPRDAWCEGSMDLTDTAFVIDETRWMRKRFKRELELLKDKFGPDNIRARWGFLTWWS